MNLTGDSRKRALSEGEAALLPALSRIQGAGSAALRDALRAAAAMEELQLSNEIIPSASMDDGKGAVFSGRDTLLAPGHPNLWAGSRAALHHALKR